MFSVYSAFDCGSFSLQFVFCCGRGVACSLHLIFGGFECFVVDCIQVGFVGCVGLFGLFVDLVVL